MPKEVVDALMKQIRGGKLPGFCKQRGLKGEKCAHAYAAVIENKMKKRKAAKGGIADEELTRSFGNYTQFPLEDEIIVEDDGVWLLAADKDTHLRLIDGRQLPVDESAHMASLGAWVSPNYEIDLHIDHRKDKLVTGTINDVRYDIDRGLYLKVKVDDEKIMNSIVKGDIRPSIETEVEIKDNVIDFYLPTGLGLMWEGEPMGEEVGVERPPAEAMEALGGDNMADEDKKTETPNAEPKEEAKEEKKTPEPPKPAADMKDEKKTEEPNYQKMYEDLMGKLKEKEGLEVYVDELRNSYVNRLPENLREVAKEMNMDELKRTVIMADAIRSEMKDRLDKLDTRVAPVIKEHDELKSEKSKVDKFGTYTDEAWAFVRAKQDLMMGRSVHPRAVEILGKDGLLKAQKEVENIKKR